MSLRDYGWDDFFSNAFDALDLGELECGRLLGSSRLLTDAGERRATVAGKLRLGTDAPTVGDWVAFRRADASSVRIEQLLPRRTKLSRKVAGKRNEEQVVAANVDVAFVVMGLDGDFSLRRLERLLTTVWESGARPVVLLNKLDVCPDAPSRQREAERVAPGVPVLLSCCTRAEGLDAVREQIRPRETAVLLGSSGVGKSTLINRFLGDTVQKTRAVRTSDDRGRHTTTERELFRLPGGGLLIDSPGIREVQLWSGERSLARAFDEITEFAARCRYRDCSHESEPGCAVLRAVQAGSLSPARLNSYRALQRELRYLELRQDESAQRIEKRQWRNITREMRRSGRHRRR